MQLDKNTTDCLTEIEKIRGEIAQSRGVLLPNRTVEVLGLLANYFYKFSELHGKHKAMRNHFFAAYLQQGMSIGKAEGLAKGTEEGQKEVYFESIAAGLQEIIQAQKKMLEHFNNQAKNLT